MEDSEIQPGPVAPAVKAEELSAIALSPKHVRVRSGGAHGGGGGSGAAPALPPDVMHRRARSRRRAAAKSGQHLAYDVEVSDLASNTLALFHNALRHEIAAYEGFAGPVVGAHVPLAAEDELVDGLLDRWTVLGRFMVLVSRIEEVVCDAVFSDVNVGFRREALAVERAHKAIAERLSYAYELFVQATSKAASTLDRNPNQQTLQKYAAATAAQIRFARDTADKCEKFVHAVDDLGDQPLRHPTLERNVFDTLKNVCREENFGFTAVQLFRWSKKESTIKRWMSRHSSSKEDKDEIMQKVQEWVKMYSERSEKGDPHGSNEVAKRDVEKAFSSESSSSSSSG